ncbi:MAG: hypothetical protein ACTHKM_12905 [Tsuneonella sp.]
MKSFILAGAAALAIALPAAAQTTMGVDAAGNAYVMTDAQQTMYTGWPADRQTSYDSWPNNYKVYYWSLTPDQQNGWWALTDDQRTKVYAMTPDQRAAAWNSIVAQLNGGPSPMASSTAMAATAAAAGASTMGPRWVSNAVVQMTPADTTASTGDKLPICTPNQQDGCINAWEAGKRGPGVTRPLDHWPGKPASEMPGHH